MPISVSLSSEFQAPQDTFPPVAALTFHSAAVEVPAYSTDIVGRLQGLIYQAR